MKNGFFKKNKILSINLLYLLSLIPIIGFSFYKNGILVYKEGYISLLGSLQYLIIPIVIVLLSYVFETYYYVGIKKEEDTHSVVNSIVPYINALCYLVCGPANFLWLTIPLIVIVDVTLKFVDNKICVNQIALFKCILFGILTLMSIKSNANLYEAALSVKVTDPSLLFLGKGIGEIGTTSTLFSIVGFIILLFNTYYKKSIPIISVISYSVIGLILYFGKSLTFNELLINTFNSGFIFVAVYVASLSTATPVTKLGRGVYAILVGVISAVFVNVLHFNAGMYITILVLSLATPLLNRLKISLEQ